MGMMGGMGGMYRSNGKEQQQQEQQQQQFGQQQQQQQYEQYKQQYNQQSTTNQLQRPVCEDQRTECPTWASYNLCDDQTLKVYLATVCCKSCTGAVSGNLIESK